MRVLDNLGITYIVCMIDLQGSVLDSATDLQFSPLTLSDLVSQHVVDTQRV